MTSLYPDFRKRLRHLSVSWYYVDGRKRYENARVDANLFMRFRQNENGGFRKRISVDKARVEIARSSPKSRRATRPVNTADCMNEWKYFLKYNINISIIIRFKQYIPSIIQPVKFTGRVARQNNGLYVLRMIVKLAYMYCRVF